MMMKIKDQKRKRNERTKDSQVFTRGNKEI